MKIFFDTSAFVKRYVTETGSDDVIELCHRADRLALSIICLPEMVSTLRRLSREGKIQEEDYLQTKDLILGDLEDVEICTLNPEVIRSCINCLEKNKLRAMDAIHLACALAIGPDIFVSSDVQQIEAAKKEGLKVVKV